MAHNHRFAFAGLIQQRQIHVTSVESIILKLQYQLQDTIPYYLQAIANADPIAVKNYLSQFPALAFAAFGTIKTYSGNTYQNITGVQLAYLMNDPDIMRILNATLKKSQPWIIENAQKQLFKKMLEVSQQKYLPLDFSLIVKAITADANIVITYSENNFIKVRASSATEKLSAEFREKIKPRNISQGKSFIEQYLLAAYKILEQHRSKWNRAKILWFQINIIAPLQSRVEKRCAQELTQGLSDLVLTGKPFDRSRKLINCIENNAYKGIEIDFRGTSDGALILGRDYFIDIFYGAVTFNDYIHQDVELLEQWATQKSQQMDDLIKELEISFVSKKPAGMKV